MGAKETPKAGWTTNAWCVFGSLTGVLAVCLANGEHWNCRYIWGDAIMAENIIFGFCTVPEVLSRINFWLRLYALMPICMLTMLNAAAFPLTRSLSVCSRVVVVALLFSLPRFPAGVFVLTVWHLKLFSHWQFNYYKLTNLQCSLLVVLHCAHLSSFCLIILHVILAPELEHFQCAKISIFALISYMISVSQSTNDYQARQLLYLMYCLFKFWWQVLPFLCGCPLRWEACASDSCVYH